MADSFGRLHLRDEEVLSTPPPQGLGGPSIVNPLREDPSILTQRIDAYLGSHAGVEDQRRVFYAVANVLFKLSGEAPMPFEEKFWDPETPLPHGLRDAVRLFEL